METKLLPDGRTAYFKDGRWIAPVKKKEADFIKLLRDLGKIMNFSALYGSGANGLANFLLREFTDKTLFELKEMANRAILSKKGRKNPETGYFEGGTDSGAFNMMANIALRSKIPTLPCLGTKITSALRPAYVGDDFIPGRMNWAIQASGSEILSLTLVVMYWLCEEYEIPIWFEISIHDEIWWITLEDRALEAAAVFQIAHLYIWALFNHQMGMDDMALSGAFFSGVAVDDRVRKTPSESTISPSNPDGGQEPPGKEWTIGDLESTGVFKKLVPKSRK